MILNTFSSILKIEDLRKKFVFTISLLAVYRIGIFVSLPGVDAAAMREYMQGGSNQFLGFVNLFSGGALEQLSIFALGVMPYISASIIFQLLGFLIPSIQKMQKEGEQGRQKN